MLVQHWEASSFQYWQVFSWKQLAQFLSLFKRLHQVNAPGFYSFFFFLHTLYFVCVNIEPYGKRMQKDTSPHPVVACLHLNVLRRVAVIVPIKLLTLLPYRFIFEVFIFKNDSIPRKVDFLFLFSHWLGAEFTNLWNSLSGYCLLWKDSLILLTPLNGFDSYDEKKNALV